MVVRGQYRRLLVVALDTVLCILAFYLAFFIRFEGRIPDLFMVSFLKSLPVIIAVRFVCFWFFGLYRGIWKYASINDLVNVFKAVITGTVLFIIVKVFLHGLEDFPRSVFAIEFLLIAFAIGGIRFGLRMYRTVMPERRRPSGRNVLIIGAGDAGNTILREMKNNPKLNYNIIGLIDDDRFKQDMNILGVPVIGSSKDIEKIVNRKKIHEIIIAIPSASRQQMRSIVETCEKTGAEIKTVPALGDMIDGTVNFSQVRDVQIEDLLGRDVVEIDTEAISAYLSGKSVLVTGAGGSIGSEICRQIMQFDLKSLVLFGRGENSIYQAHSELRSMGRDIKLVQLVGDVINRRKLEGTFRAHKPDIVFHAGADKHVPLLESNPDEAVLNNIIGTKNVVEVAEESGVEKVVCISTDKAADPVSVMGAAKRVAEIIVQGRKHGRTKSMCVRFGNVLGSRGSVIPLFRRQIHAGGPVTITHPDMLRYFMTIPEASRLVLQAGAIGEGGEVFLLDMGNPVKIIDLANQMIRLSGFEPESDIQVKTIGLRPGEKLEETLTGRDEKLSRTVHPKILAIHFNGRKPEFSDADFGQLRDLAIAMDRDGIIRKLRGMLPNYSPD